MKYSGLPQALKIIDIRAENSYINTYILAGSLAAQPGQFVMVWLPGLEDKPFSLSQADPLQLTIAAVGPFTRAIAQLQVGDYLWVRGPLGHGFHLPPGPASDQHLLLIGGGYGVAPLLFLARQARAAGGRVSMMIGARRQTDLLLVEEFEALGVPLWLTTEDGSAGRQGLVTEALPEVLRSSTIPPTGVYACGPTGMLNAVANWGATAQIPVQLSWEAHMRCGLGLCGSCEVGSGWLTCLDGPVFPFNPITISPPDKGIIVANT